MIDVNAVLLKLLQAIEKTSSRQYAQSIGIVGNKAYVTDGFCAIRWSPEYSIGQDRVLTASLNETPIKYPGIAGVFPEDLPITITAPERFDSLLKVLKPSWAETPMVINIVDQHVSLIPYDEKGSYTGVLFNPKLLVNCSKGIPKNFTCIGAGLSDDKEKLMLNFDSPKGLFQVLLLSLRQ